MTKSVPAIGLRFSSTSQHLTPVSSPSSPIEFERRHLEFALGALGLRGGGAHLGRPIGPDGELVFLLRRLRADVELGDRDRALAEGGADAVGRGVAAADDDDMLAAGEDRPAASRAAMSSPPTRRFCCDEIGHGVMHAVEIDAGNAGRSRGVSEPPQ